MGFKDNKLKEEAAEMDFGVAFKSVGDEIDTDSDIEIDIEIDADNEETNSDKSKETEFFKNELIVEYLKTLGDIPLLTIEQEIETARKVKEGDKKARELMIVSNLKLVVNIAKHYRVPGIEPMDLIQEGNQGLMTAVERFDVDKGYKFSTYATWWIKQAISRYIMNCGRTIRIPVHVLELHQRVEKCRKKLLQELFREPTPAEIAEKMSIDESKITHILNVTEELKSLDSPVKADDGHEDSVIGDFIADTSLTPEEEYYQTELHDTIMKILLEKKPDGKDKFTPREREIVLKRFGFYGGEYTLEQLGQEMGVTRERIRQIEAKAIKKLRMPSTSRRLKPFLDK